MKTTCQYKLAPSHKNGWVVVMKNSFLNKLIISGQIQIEANTRSSKGAQGSKKNEELRIDIVT
eukprot:CAMPEP_0184460500 /NCGR_PEP_ID=MMETSP0740-20130409/40830_1 /TAXON_ID=385413 /ORGANISM="Thalassiosira miniscula, Strain CCMP1093" /LENGTH=62 /DNA_ID=CAMNT_0026833819 /DNA_START=77 /DNA_END=261 /DNA_ORIENTATION=-